MDGSMLGVGAIGALTERVWMPLSTGMKGSER